MLVEKSEMEMAVQNKHKVKWIADVETIMVSCTFNAPVKEYSDIGTEESQMRALEFQMRDYFHKLAEIIALKLLDLLKLARMDCTYMIPLDVSQCSLFRQAQKHLADLGFGVSDAKSVVTELIGASSLFRGSG